MKRYRVTTYDFDARANLLALEIRDDWEEQVRALHVENQRLIRQGLFEEFGTQDGATKIQNFLDLGPKPVSVIAFHNHFAQQARVAFVMGSYYPSLTACCALGERILNHLIIRLRGHYRATPEYKRVHRKQSIDDWTLAINTLESWNVLLPEAVGAFRELAVMRHRSIHFNPEIESDVRTRALEANGALNRIIGSQFSAFGQQRWFIPGIPGASYLSQEAESEPFIREIYLPHAHLVGPCHRLEWANDHFVLHDDFAYPEVEISDDDFRELLPTGARHSDAPCGNG